MKLHILFPPLSDFTQPYASLPCLTAFLRKQGVDVCQWDLNMEFISQYFEPEKLDDLVAGLRLMFSKLDAKPELTESETGQFSMLCRIVPFFDVIPKRIAGARNTFQNMDSFVNPAAYLDARRTTELLFDMLSVAFFPTRITSDYYLMRYSHNSSAEILEATKDAKENLFYDYFLEVIASKLQKEQPQIVGISIMFEAQIIAGFTLARLLKEALPEVCVIIGGGIVSRIWKGLSGSLHKFPFIDGVGVFEGEETLLGLAEKGTDPANWKDIPNLIYRDTDNTIRVNKFSTIQDLSILPPPDFDGLPLDLYLSPVLTPFLPVTRGCYWNRCTFCAYGLSQTTCAKYRAKPAQLVADEIRFLAKKYGARHFIFSVDCVAPNDLKNIADALIQSEADIVWQSDVRFDAGLDRSLLKKLRQSGCISLIFGLESACQRILDKMDKGIKVPVMERILGDCKDLGIAVNVGCFMGFPSETQQEAEMTVDFLIKHKNSISTVAFGIFFLLPGSRVYLNPEKYGIKTIFHNPDYDLPKSVGFGYDQKEQRGAIYSWYQGLQEKLYSAFYSAPFPFAGTGSSPHDIILIDLFGPLFCRNLFLNKAAQTRSVVPGEKDTGSCLLVLNPRLSFCRIGYDLNAMDRAITEKIASIKTESLDRGITWHQALNSFGYFEGFARNGSFFLIGDSQDYRVFCLGILFAQLLFKLKNGVRIDALKKDPLSMVAGSGFDRGYRAWWIFWWIVVFVPSGIPESSPTGSCDQKRHIVPRMSTRPDFFSEAISEHVCADGFHEPQHSKERKMEKPIVPLFDISVEDLENFTREVDENLAKDQAVTVVKIEGNLDGGTAEELKRKYPDAELVTSAGKLKEGRINVDVVFPASIDVHELADMKKISLLSTLFASGCHMGMRK